jgi:hypothetical protein
MISRSSSVMSRATVSRGALSLKTNVRIRRSLGRRPRVAAPRPGVARPFVSSRAHAALLLSGLLALASIAVGVDLMAERACEVGDGCVGSDVAWVLGIPAIALGAGLIAYAVFGWGRAPGLTAQVSCIVWACVVLAVACGIGGAANAAGILLGMLAITMGALSVWVPR